METSDKTTTTDDKKKTRKSTRLSKINKLWIQLIMVYAFLFASIGYIAFWTQDFNDPDKFLRQYELLREKHFEVVKKYYSELSQTEIDEYNTYINEYMKSANDTAGDLQELATQSFNIVLGSLLAFLSATATMVFQENNSGSDNHKE